MKHHRRVSRIPKRAEADTEPQPNQGVLFVLDVLIAALQYVGTLKRM